MKRETRPRVPLPRVDGRRSDVAQPRHHQFDILDGLRLSQPLDDGALAARELLIVLEGQQHVRRAAAIGNEDRPTAGGVFGPASVLIELATRKLGDRHAVARDAGSYYV